MEFKYIIEKRQSFRALEKIEITQDFLDNLSYAISRTPSCFNNQPWRFIFVWEEPQLSKLKESLNDGNYWAKEASMIAVAYTNNNLDCQIKEREYALFDTGMSVASLIYRTFDLGLIAHPIAGYKPLKVREALHIPENYNVICLIIIGKRNHNIRNLSEKHQISEIERSQRKKINEIIQYNYHVE